MINYVNVKLIRSSDFRVHSRNDTWDSVSMTIPTRSVSASDKDVTFDHSCF